MSAVGFVDETLPERKRGCIGIRLVLEAIISSSLVTVLEGYIVRSRLCIRKRCRESRPEMLPSSRVLEAVSRAVSGKLYQ